MDDLSLFIILDPTVPKDGAETIQRGLYILPWHTSGGERSQGEVWVPPRIREIDHNTDRFTSIFVHICRCYIGWIWLDYIALHCITFHYTSFLIIFTHMFTRLISSPYC